MNRELANASLDTLIKLVQNAGESARLTVNNATLELVVVAVLRGAKRRKHDDIQCAGSWYTYTLHAGSTEIVLDSTYNITADIARRAAYTGEKIEELLKGRAR